MKVYIPVMNSTPSKRGYLSLDKAKQALKKMYASETKKYTYLKQYSVDELGWIDSYLLVK